jgi:hypothetical protein
LEAGSCKIREIKVIGGIKEIRVIEEIREIKVIR